MERTFLSTDMSDLLHQLPFPIGADGKFKQGVFATTNQVFFGLATLADSEVETPVVIKIGLPSLETRECWVGSRGGWLKNRLDNEKRLISLAESAGISVPRVFHYHQDAVTGMEILVLQKLSQENCYQLRTSLNDIDATTLEKAKGNKLAEIGAIKVGQYSFGPLSTESTTFISWREYFNTKLRTTLETLSEKYNELTNLANFPTLAVNEIVWKQILEHVGGLYASDLVQNLLDGDGKPTVVHGDYWDGNLMALKVGDIWEVSVIDWERGEIGGASFDLALWLAWKEGGNPNAIDPLLASKDFLTGYEEAGGVVSQEIKSYIAIYGLWQYLDFLLTDLVYGLDRSAESVFEIKRLSQELEGLVAQDWVII